MSLSGLPVELVYHITEYLDFERDINALVRISKRFYDALNSYLYRHHVRHWGTAGFEYACSAGLSNAMRMFLDEGMPLDTSDVCSRPINKAAKLGREDIVKYLLEKGVDPNEKQEKHVWGGPFEYAAKCGHEGTVRVLAPYMKSVDYFAADMTPLAAAAEYGHLSLVKMMVEELRCNVEPTWVQGAGKVTNGFTPLAAAAGYGHTDVVRYLLSVGADPNANLMESWRTPLAYAVYDDYLEAAKALIEYGADPDPIVMIQQERREHRDEADEDTHTEAIEKYIFPFSGAIPFKKLDTVKLMFQYIDLERTLECDIEDLNFLLPLAAACGLEDIVQRLLERGCDVNTRLTIGSKYWRANMGNALTFASMYGHLGVARILLGHRVDPNEPEVGGHIKPLVAAVNGGHQELVDLLLDAGANPNIMDGEGNPMYWLAINSKPTILKTLLDRGFDQFTLGPFLFEDVLKCNDESILRTVLETGFGLSMTKEPGSFEHIIQLVARVGAATFECMMQHFWEQYGLKPSPQDEASQLALESAMENKNAKVVEILLERYGLELESRNMVDYLTWAASGRGKDHDTIAASTLDVLRRHGADINATRSDGHTCLSLLVSKEDVQGAELVIKQGAKYPMACPIPDEYLLTIATRIGADGLLESLLELIDAQGISLEDIEPHLQQAQANIPDESCVDTCLLQHRLRRALEYFRCRRKYPVPEK